MKKSYNRCLPGPKGVARVWAAAPGAETGGTAHNFLAETPSPWQQTALPVGQIIPDQQGAYS